LSRRRDGPWLAHRLDADTSGCLVVALRRAALLAAQAEFAAGRAEKIYWAVVRGAPSADQGVVDLALSKRSTPAGWRMVADAGGQRAVTGWRVLARNASHAWLELRPRTGRTHQIRVHCAALGCPIEGDQIYGEPAGPLALLARSIRLDLQPELCATAPPPAHMRRFLDAMTTERKDVLF
jgi:tRNA pseudouridine32 synthase/23S rRNA pseudouridine746 synthase